MAAPVIWRVLAVMSFILVVWFGLRPEPIPDVTANTDKWSHFIAFGFCSLAMFFALSEWPVGFTAIVMVTFGFGIEVLQKLFLPHRTFDLKDVAMDAAGILLALVCYSVLKFISHEGKKPIAH